MHRFAWAGTNAIICRFARLSSMSLYTLKPRFQALLRPSVRALHALGVTANQVTVGACAGSLMVGSGLVIAAELAPPQWFLLLPVWLLLRMAMNAMDGLLAREYGQSSALGAYLNELCDLLSDAALYLPLAFLPGAGGVLTTLVIVLSNLSEMAGVLGVAAANGRHNDGPMGKSDRAFVLGALGLLLGVGIAPGPWLSWVLSVTALLLVWTIANRVRRGLAEDRGVDSEQPGEN
jgi:CDP-diacylglycerol--glycerol-3-phosphate 3-phosphatidyltransferase